MNYISENELKKLKPCCKDYYGDYGSCYLYDGSILKVFKNNIRCNELEEIKRNINNLLKIKINNVAFPLEIIKVESHPFAYLMPVIPGIKYSDIIDKIFYDASFLFDVSFLELINSYHDACLKIFDISEKKIIISDLRDENCKLIQNNCFGLFDLDFYKKSNLFSLDELKNINLNLLNIMFSNYFEDILRKIVNYSDSDIDEIKYLVDTLNYLTDVSYNKKINEKIKFVDSFLDEVNKKTKTDSLRKLMGW